MSAGKYNVTAESAIFVFDLSKLARVMNVLVNTCPACAEGAQREKKYPGSIYKSLSTNTAVVSDV